MTGGHEAEAQGPEGDPHLLRQTLRVAAVDGGSVRLEAERASACASCRVRTSCGAAAMADLAGPGRFEITVPHTYPVTRGDEVVVTCPSSAFLGAAALGYLLPSLALALVAGLGAALSWPDWVTAGLCLPILALSLLPLRRAERRGRMHSALRIAGVVARGTREDQPMPDAARDRLAGGA